MLCTSDMAASSDLLFFQSLHCVRECPKGGSLILPKQDKLKHSLGFSLQISSLKDMASCKVQGLNPTANKCISGTVD